MKQLRITNFELRISASQRDATAILNSKFIILHSFATQVTR